MWHARGKLDINKIFSLETTRKKENCGDLGIEGN